MDLHTLNAIRVPGLTDHATEIIRLAEDIQKHTAIYLYKQALPCLCVVFIGGTGTGKSTLFNALCGASLSEAGVERPKTGGAVAYVHEDCPIDTGFPFPSLSIERYRANASRPATGSPAAFTVMTHGHEALSHLMIVDTPDLDSVAAPHRKLAQDLQHLSDAVLFVMSPEKYADQVPHLFLQTLLDAALPLYILFNKADMHISDSEIRKVLRPRDGDLNHKPLWRIPYVADPDWRSILNTPGFQSVKAAVMQRLSKEKSAGIRRTRRRGRAQRLNRDVKRLTQLMTAETQAAAQWRADLNTLCRHITEDLMETEKRRFSSQSREYLSGEIRRLFDRYDVLARPRRFVKGLVTAPLRLLGITHRLPKSSKAHMLSKVREKTDLSDVFGAMEKLRRRVLEEFSPQDPKAPLFTALRDPSVVLSHSEIQEMIYNEQENIADWLEKKFAELMQGIPAGKRLGIYATSLVWGILLVSFETAVGGGFTILDAALDSAIAPFLTKGAVELFAFQEVRKIARELAHQYHNALVSVVSRQCRRYEACVTRLLPDETAVKTLTHIRMAVKT